MDFFEEESKPVQENRVVGKTKDRNTIELEFKEKKEENSLWVEKYRPRYLEDYVGNDSIKKRIGAYISSGDIPHILLSGPAGTGKTTIAKMIANSIECDVMYINASDENSVDTVREKIKNFACGCGMKPLKVCILDEMDFLSPNAMAAMRNIMETYSASTRFIMTCNYEEKVIPAIKSRTQSETVVPPDKKSVAKHLNNVLVAEKVEFEMSDIGFLVNAYYPDIRKIINSAQQFSKNSENRMKIDQSMLMSADSKSKILTLIKKNDKDSFSEIRQILAEKGGLKHYDDYYNYLYENIDDWAKGRIGEMVILLAEMQYRGAMAPNKEINFMSCISSILDKLK